MAQTARSSRIRIRACASSCFNDSSSEGDSRLEVGKASGLGLPEGVESAAGCGWEVSFNVAMFAMQQLQGFVVRPEIRTELLARQCSAPTTYLPGILVWPADRAAKDDRHQCLNVFSSSRESCKDLQTPSNSGGAKGQSRQSSLIQRGRLASCWLALGATPKRTCPNWPSARGLSPPGFPWPA